MGTLSEFKCPECGHLTEISGGVDFGIAGVTATISCTTCNELFDAWAMENPWEIDKMNRFDEPIKPDELTGLRCPKSRRHKWTAWSHPGPCPRCGTTMDKGSVTMMWD